MRCKGLTAKPYVKRKSRNKANSRMVGNTGCRTEVRDSSAREPGSVLREPIRRQAHLLFQAVTARCRLAQGGIGTVNYGALFRSALVALLRNKMRSTLTVLGITIGIAAVICVVAIGKAGQARVEQQLNNLGDHFVWIEAGGRAGNGGWPGTPGTKTLC